MEKKLIKVNIADKEIFNKELNSESLLIDIRKELSDLINFPFLFRDKDSKEIQKENESNIKLKEILIDNNLNIERIMLGNKIESKNGLDIYLYPQKIFSKEEKDKSLNILVLGETGVGKSTWLQSFINYIQNIQIKENNRYYLFNERNINEDNLPAIYNIDTSILYKKPIRVIDTNGFGDTRGKEYDKKIFDDIKKLFQSSDIDSINTICIFYKACQGRLRYNPPYFIKFLISLFGDEIKNNIVIIFSFTDFFNDIFCLQNIKDKNNLLIDIFGSADNIPYFAFDNSTYFKNKNNLPEIIYKNNCKNFEKFIQHISELKRISLLKKINDKKEE